MPSTPEIARDRRRAAVAAVQRELIIEGFAEAISARGYRATTISDIAAAAHISKTTFYEHFADKEAVFLALHASVAETMTSAMEGARRESAGEADWRELVRRVVGAYLDRMSDSPAFLLQVIVEAAATSEATRRARDQAFDRFADWLTQLTRELANAHPELQPLSHELAIAALAGVLELVVRAAPDGPDAVRAVAPSASELLIRVIGGRAGADERPRPAH